MLNINYFMFNNHSIIQNGIRFRRNDNFQIRVADYVCRKTKYDL